MEPSFSDSQSFEVFHDSWAHHSRNMSRGDISHGGSSRGDISHRGNVSRGGIVSRCDINQVGNVSGVQGQKNGSFVGGAPASRKNLLGERRFVLWKGVDSITSTVVGIINSLSLSLSLSLFFFFLQASPGASQSTSSSEWTLNWLCCVAVQY